MKVESSYQVLDALEKHNAFKCGEGAPHILLREVSNGTGFKSTRYADGLLVSLWPSRGIFFAGIEVKVSRGNWLSELKNPAKSAAIQKWCNFWWLVTLHGVTKPEEIPEKWGLVEVSSGGKCKVVKKAPQLEAERPSQTFVAAILRNRAKEESQLVALARSAEREELIASQSVVDERELADMKREIKRLKEAKESIDELCKVAGINIYELIHDAGRMGAQFKLAGELLGGRMRRYSWQPKDLRDLADKLEEAQALADSAREQASGAAKQIAAEIGGE